MDHTVLKKKTYDHTFFYQEISSHTRVAVCTIRLRPYVAYGYKCMLSHKKKRMFRMEVSLHTKAAV